MLALAGLAGCADEVADPVDAGEVVDEADQEDANQTVAPAVLVAVADVLDGTAPLNLTIRIDVIDAAGPVAWNITSNGTVLANGTSVPANATLILEAGNHTLVVATDDGLSQTIRVNVTGSALALADVTASPGMRIPVVTGATGTCAWDIPDASQVVDAGACDTEVRFNSIGAFPATVTIDGQAHAITITTVMPEPADRVTGSLFMYNQGGAGVSNVAALGISEYHYVTGDTVSTQGRAMGGERESIAAGAEYFFLDPEGNIVAGPLSAGAGTGADWTGAPLAITKATFPVDGGRYYLGAVAYMADGPTWVTDTSDARSGFKGFLVHHAA